VLRLALHHTPPIAPEGELAVVIDVLRWTTTSVVACANGAAGIEAFATPGEAQARAAAIGALTAGERNAHRIPGFDLGNSPREFTRERVEGRVICATTTNGTRALLAAQGASQIFVAAFVNLSATAEAIRRLAPRHVDIICAGSEGEPSPEDSACGEALAAMLRSAPSPISPSSVLSRAPHAAHLVSLGYGEDVAMAGALDANPLVCRYRAGRVVGEERRR